MIVQVEKTSIFREGENLRVFFYTDFGIIRISVAAKRLNKYFFPRHLLLKDVWEKWRGVKIMTQEELKKHNRDIFK